jgi:hypothetical protein
VFDNFITIRNIRFLKSDAGVLLLEIAMVLAAEKSSANHTLWPVESNDFC